MPKDGLAWIALKVLFKVVNIIFGPFSHIYPIYPCYSVVSKCCPMFLHDVTSLEWCQWGPSISFVCRNSKSSTFEGQKVKLGPLWYIGTDISESVIACLVGCISWIMYTLRVIVTYVIKSVCHMHYKCAVAFLPNFGGMTYIYIYIKPKLINLDVNCIHPVFFFR